ncbi:MAG: hypothetical protein JXA24_04945 [Proteobacteria bacterium]|nr:hypothetical protein [Pseudomonadota bacterium]
MRVDDQAPATAADILADDIFDAPVQEEAVAEAVVDDEIPPSYRVEEDAAAEEVEEEEEEEEPNAEEKAAPPEPPKERELAWLLHMAPSPQYRIFMDLAGEGVESGLGGLGLAFDAVTNVLESGARFSFGAHFHGFRHAMFTGVRLGAAGDISDSIFLKLMANLDYVGISGPDRASPYVPIELNDPPVTADGTAYSFTPISMDMSMRGAALTISPEIAVMFKRWDIGGGKTLGLGAFLALEAGLYVGAVTDDGCAYAYDPGSSDGVHVRPDGTGNASFTQEGSLGSRCRADETSFGVIFGGQAGLTLEFGL